MLVSSKEHKERSNQRNQEGRGTKKKIRKNMENFQRIIF
jgi:hypothetical protein